MPRGVIATRKSFNFTHQSIDTNSFLDFARPQIFRSCEGFPVQYLFRLAVSTNAMKPHLSLQQNIATVQLDSLILKVDAGHGARIVSFAADGEEVLTQQADHAENFGSTLWDAPQTRWGWPPPFVLDSAPYAAHSDGTQIEFVGAVDGTCGLQFIKRVKPLVKNKAVQIEYEIRNAGIQSISTAAWEISRSPAGLTFLPSLQLAEDTESTLPGVEFIGGCAWYEVDPLPLNIGKKAFFDVTGGWLAHVAPNRQLFIKAFAPLHQEQYSPGHAAVEVYAHIDGAYVELENHGPRTLLQPGESLSYRVQWRVAAIPERIELKARSSELVEFARQILRAEKP